jgi:hypothetical protein
MLIPTAVRQDVTNECSDLTIGTALTNLSKHGFLLLAKGALASTDPA